MYIFEGIGTTDDPSTHMEHWLVRHGTGWVEGADIEQRKPPRLRHAATVA